jgi:hypothetical protein
MAASGWAFMFVSPATVTRVNGRDVDEHEAAKISSTSKATAKDIRLRVTSMDVKTYIRMFSFLKSWWNAKAERLERRNPALFRGELE